MSGFKLKMVEQNIEVDKNDNQIGLRPRDDFYTGKYIHRSSHLILFNSKNEILLQHRAPTKKWYPNLFTYSVSGTVANESYEDCLGLHYRNSFGNIIQNPPRPLIQNLDELPFPDRTLFEEFPAPFIRIVGSRGCSGTCTFCDGSLNYVDKCTQVRIRSAKNMLNEIELLQKKYNIDSYIFSDSTFNDPKATGNKRISDLINEIKNKIRGEKVLDLFPFSGYFLSKLQKLKKALVLIIGNATKNYLKS